MPSNIGRSTDSSFRSFFQNLNGVKCTNNFLGKSRILSNGHGLKASGFPARHFKIPIFAGVFIFLCFEFSTPKMWKMWKTPMRKSGIMTVFRPRSSKRSELSTFLVWKVWITKIYPIPLFLSIFSNFIQLGTFFCLSKTAPVFLAFMFVKITTTLCCTLQISVF